MKSHTSSRVHIPAAATPCSCRNVSVEMVTFSTISETVEKVWLRGSQSKSSKAAKELEPKENQSKVRGLCKLRATDPELLVTQQPGPSPLQDVDRPRTYQLSAWHQMWPWLPRLGTDDSDSRQGQPGCKVSSPLKSTRSDTLTASSSGHQSELWRSPSRIASPPTPHCLNPCISGCQGTIKGQQPVSQNKGLRGDRTYIAFMLFFKLPKRCIL